MNTEIIIVKDDHIWRRTHEEWSAELNPIYQVQVAPRCTRLPIPFKHEVGIRYYALSGNVLFEAGDELTALKEGRFIFIPATLPYFFQGLDRTPSMLLAQPGSLQAEESWREVAEIVRSRRQTAGIYPG